MEIHGVFSTYKLTNQEKDLFAEYLQHVMNNPVIEFVRYLLGDDYLKFIDILSGTTFKIPSSKSLEKDLESVRIYIYVSKGGFTEESIKSASKIFGKTVLTTRRYTYKVCKALGVEDTLEGDSLNNYILNIKSVNEPDKISSKDDTLDIDDTLDMCVDECEVYNE